MRTTLRSIHEATTAAKSISERARALGTNPRLPDIVALEKSCAPADLRKLQNATRNAFGGGVPWLWALENEGL